MGNLWPWLDGDLRIGLGGEGVGQGGSIIYLGLFYHGHWELGSCRKTPGPHRL